MEGNSYLNELETRLAVLQRKLKDVRKPMLILIEGFEAAGKGTIINRLIKCLDPRGYNVHTIQNPNDEERMRPMFYRFMLKNPSEGRIAVFDRSWYSRILEERIIDKGYPLKKAVREIDEYEDLLVSNGTLLLKYFLDITKNEQKKRFKILKSNSATAFRVSKEDMRQNAFYKDYKKLFWKMITKSKHPFQIIDSEKGKKAYRHLLESIVLRAEEELQSLKEIELVEPKEISTLSFCDIIKAEEITRKDYVAELKNLQKELHFLEHKMYTERKSLVIAFEGWDAAGKGGNIKRLIGNLDPRGYEVVPIGAPTDYELRQHYLHRFYSKLPKDGHLTIYDRSWYGRVLVERVEGFAKENEWKRAFKEIVDFEREIIEHGGMLLKFFLNISKEEQLNRFTDRENTPAKRYKITDEDYRNREKWDMYEKAYEDMFRYTDSDFAPWYIIDSNDKLNARLATLKIVVETLKKNL